MTAEEISNFRTDRYADLNRIRWEQFLSMEIPLEGKTIFEPGAGIGDQTEWLLKQGAGHIYVQDGRDENTKIIRERFGYEPRVTILGAGNLEVCLPEIPFHGLDLVYCYGVYYHISDDMGLFPIMRAFAEIGKTIVVEYLEGNDHSVHYGYDNTSTSLTRYGSRPRTETLLKAMKDIWGHSYSPKNQLQWTDPIAVETRLIAVASKFDLANEQLEQFSPELVTV